MPGNGTTRNVTVGIAMKSNVTLRGMGANLTILNWTSDGSCNGFGSNVCVSDGYLEMNTASPTNVKNWTAGYAKGTTVITLSAVTNLQVGSLLGLFQDNDTSDPGVGLEFICSVTGTCSNGDSGGGGCPSCSPRREQEQWVLVTAINGNTVTLADPILANNWASGKNPKAAYLSTLPITGVGLEDFAHTLASGSRGIEFMYAANSWVKGVKSKNSGRHHVDVFGAAHIEVRDSYFYEGQDHGSQSYGVECIMGSQIKVENNIITRVTAPFIQTGSCTGSVIAYNYSRDDIYTNASGWLQPDHYYHATGSNHNLHEGNIGIGVISDNVHGPVSHITAFRNYFRGTDNSCNGAACSAQTNAVHLYAQSRFFNLIGNVLGENTYHTKYESFTGNTSNCYLSVYQMDFSGNQCDTVTYASDSSVRTGSMRWGNYDTVNDATRFVSSEVPTAIAGTYDNPEPASQALPSSFYLSAKPTWYGHNGVSINWPSIGPDVTGGDMSGLGGHVYTNPAKACYDGSTFSGLEITDFNAATCYAAIVIAAHSGLSGIVRFGGSIRLP